MLLHAREDVPGIEATAQHHRHGHARQSVRPTISWLEPARRATCAHLLDQLPSSGRRAGGARRTRVIGDVTPWCPISGLAIDSHSLEDWPDEFVDLRGRLARLIPDGDLPRPAYRPWPGGTTHALADGRIPSEPKLPERTGSHLTRVLPDHRHPGMPCCATTTTSPRAEVPGSDLSPARSAHAGSGGAGSVPGRDLDPGVIDLSARRLAPGGIADAMAAAVALLPRPPRRPTAMRRWGCRTARGPGERYRRRGPSDLGQILVTSGRSPAWRSSAAPWCGPARVPVEDPTYPQRLEALVRSGARLGPSPVDPEGWDLGEPNGRRRLPRPPPTSSRTSTTRPVAPRRRLAGPARRGTARRRNRPRRRRDDRRHRPAPPSAHPDAPVRRARPRRSPGSAAKSFWGGLRIGWMRVPVASPNGSSMPERRSTSAPHPRATGAHRDAARWPDLPDGRAAGPDRAREATMSAPAGGMPAARLVPPPGGLSLWIARHRRRPIAEGGRGAWARHRPGPRFHRHGRP